MKNNTQYKNLTFALKQKSFIKTALINTAFSLNIDLISLFM